MYIFSSEFVFILLYSLYYAQIKLLVLRLNPLKRTRNHCTILGLVILDFFVVIIIFNKKNSFFFFFINKKLFYSLKVLTYPLPGPHGIRGRRYPQKTPQIVAPVMRECAAHARLKLRCLR